MIKNLVNHIVFVVDASGSMDEIQREVIKVFDGQIAHLAQRSKELNQETRASVYLFNNTTSCLIYDMDVMRLPSLSKHYKPSGGTALIDGTLKAFEDLKLTPEIYGDHAFLIYVLTDGQENQSGNAPTTLSRAIKDLPDNWTVATLVPDAIGVAEAKKFGFPAQNIQVWSTTSAGVNEVGEVMNRATDNFMRARSTGVRSTKNLFSLDASALNKSVVKSNLKELTTKEYKLLPVHQDKPIKEFVESWTSEPYRPGSAYFLLTKPETIQNYKQVCIQDKTNGKVYSGSNARELLGLPDYEVRVSPAQHANFDIFLQSTSLNRKLVKGTKLIVLN